MKAIVILIAVMSVMSISALPPVPASLPPAVHADMEVTANIDFSTEAVP